MLRNVRLIYLHNLLTEFRFQAAYAIIYFQQVTGTYTLATLILATEVIAAAAFDIPTGIFSDKVGRKFTLAAGSASTMLALVCYAFGHSLGMFFLGAALFGLGVALFSGNNNALLYESLKAHGQERRYHHYLGRTCSMFQIGLGTSALLASFIAPHGLRYVFVFAIVPQILATIASFFFIEPRTHIENKEKNFAHLLSAAKQVWHNPRLRLIAIGNAFSYGVGESVFMFSSAYVNMLWPIWAVAIYRALAHTLGFTGYWFSGRILDRVKPAVMMAFTSAYWLVVELGATLMANVLTPLFFVSGSFLFGPSMVARDHIMQEEFTDRQRATLASVVSFTSSLVSGAAALGLGIIADHFGLTAALVAGIVTTGFALPVFVQLFRKHFRFSKK